MIPHRMLSNEIAGSGLKDRVTACRKRLRESRVLKARTDISLGDEFSEVAAPLIQLRDYAANDFDTGKQTEELEVGIT